MSLLREVTMSNLTQNFANPNNQPLIIGNFSIRQDEDGRYSLADLHKASGNLAKHKPSNFLRVEQTQELIKEIEQVSDMSLGEKDQFSNTRSAVKVIHGGNNRGTYAVKEMVYAYAMWISAKFHLMVIRAYDAMVMQWKINDRQSISPEQQALLHEIVDRRSQGERKIFAEMWARHNRHFKIPRYAELLAIHFPEAIHYLETMELKARVSTKQDNLIQIDKNYHNNVQGLAWHMLWIREWWKKFGEPIRAISPNMAAAIHDHFVDGAMFAYHFIDKEDLKKQRERTEYFQWHLSSAERISLDYRLK